MTQGFGRLRGAGKLSYLLQQLLSPHLLGDAGEIPGWVQLGSLSSSFRVWEWEAGGQKGRETGPSHPQVSEGPDGTDGEIWVHTLWRKEK